MAKETKEQKKLTYEELENFAHQLSDQSKKLYQSLQEANMTNVFKRLDYLFKVVEFYKLFIEAGKADFVEASIKEIESLMTIPEEATIKDSAEPTEDN